MRKLVFAAGLAVLVAAVSLPSAAQSRSRSQGDNTFTFFGGALLGNSSGFAVGAGVGLPITEHVSFEPTAALGRTGSDTVFTLDGSFLYNFHLRDSHAVPYVLGGVGLAQFGGVTHGSPIIGGGVRIPFGRELEIRPEIRAATHGLSRFTIGVTKSW